jgi:lipopolysaccharide transport system permease protein
MWGKFVELYRFREMLYVLVYRDIKSQTKQAFLGYAWVIIQPLLATGVFTILVQSVLGLKLTERVPYPVFLMTGMVLWQYFSNSLTVSTESLTGNVNLLTQVYFPKDILILYPIFAKLVDLGVSLLVLATLLVVFRVPVAWTLVFAPLMVLITMVMIYGLGLFLAPLNVAFRDVARALPVLLSFALYVTPVVYPLEQVPPPYRTWYLLNPMATVIEGFRGVLLGGQLPPLWALAWALGLSLLVLVLGQRAFRLVEMVLADVV